MSANDWNPSDLGTCAHGSLRRSCEVCERDAEIEQLRAELSDVKYYRDAAILERDALQAERDGARIEIGRLCEYLDAAARAAHGWIEGTTRNAYSPEALHDTINALRERAKKAEDALRCCKDYDMRKRLTAAELTAANWKQAIDQAWSNASHHERRLRRAVELLDSFELEGLNGVICSIPEAGIDTPVNRIWCGNCRARWRAVRDFLAEGGK